MKEGQRIGIAGTALATLACGFFARDVLADVLHGRVVSVADGDTVTLLVDQQQVRVRMAGIDAPEKAQPFGQRSKQNLAALVFGKDVEADCPKTDRYKRSVCRIVINGVDVSLEQVKAGMAWWYRQYAKEQTAKDREDYEVAEFEAKSRRIGLWAEKNPVPPWGWRSPTRN